SQSCHPPDNGTAIRILCMHSPFRLALLASAGVLAAFTATGVAQRGAASNTQADAVARIVAAAQGVLTTLDEPGRARAQFPFDSPQKSKWSNLPGPMFQRNGVRLADLTAIQRDAVMKLLSVALSRDG